MSDIYIVLNIFIKYITYIESYTKQEGFSFIKEFF